MIMEKFIFMPMYYIFAVLAIYYLINTWRKLFIYVKKHLSYNIKVR